MKKTVYNTIKHKRTKNDVTLHVVAKVAGVSPITVSRVMNHPNKVSPKTLKKVQQAISQTGYVPNLLAGALHSKSSKLVAAIIPAISNVVYTETMRCFSECFRNAGYQVVIGDSGYDEEEEEKLVMAVLSRKPDAIFLTGVNHTLACKKMLLSANIPVVETSDLTPSPLDIVIGFNHEKVGQEVANFILENNYSTVGFISTNDSRSLRRQQSVQSTLEENGINDFYFVYVPAPSSMGHGRVGATKLLEQGFTKGIIFCGSDTLAHGVLAELHYNNVSIPEDIAVFGFGDQVFAEFTHPRLTTVRINRAKMGQLAAETLLTKINGEELPENIIDLGFEIIKRDTA